MVSPKYGDGLPSFSGPSHERLKDREKMLPFVGTALLANLVRRNAHERILVERGERVVCLIGQRVAVGEEQDARMSRRLAA